MKPITELLQQETVTDAEILDCAYAVENYQAATSEHRQQLAALRARLNEMETMKRTALFARAAGQQVRAQIADCGHYTIEIMSTSQGTSCPDCSDRMSD